MDILMRLKNKNPFTSEQSLEDYLRGLRRRYARVYGEILNIKDYDTTIEQLKGKGLLKGIC
jgi:hypothetical protein